MEYMTMSKKIKISFTSKDSTKISELNQILDKISLNDNLSQREKEFLDGFEGISDEELKDYNYLSLLDLFYIMSKINKPIICDIKDHEGRINDLITSMEYNHDDCILKLGLKHGKIDLKDNFLYKLIYQFKHNNYSMDIESEYYEKITLNND